MTSPSALACMYSQQAMVVATCSKLSSSSNLSLVYYKSHALLVQGKAADAAGIQFRVLNASKGPAVRGPRAQMDRRLYKQKMQQLLTNVPQLEVVDGAVTNVLLEGRTGQSQAGKTIAGVMLASGDCTGTAIA